MNKLAFVIPWYGPDIPGGSEAACRNIAERIAKRGIEVEVLTTCVKDFYSDWSINYHKAGCEIINGVTVRRFKIRKRNTELFDSINKRLMNNEKVSYSEEQIYLKESVNSPGLEEYLKNHSNDYTAIIFTPYMFGTTYNGIKNALDKAILFPAFHDESYAYFKSFRELYSKVKGIVFNSDAEKEWAEKYYEFSNVKTRVIGLGIKDFHSDPSRFRNKFKIFSPFILYAGRKDRGKNVHILVDYFDKYVNQRNIDLKLILIGGGKIDTASSLSNRIIDLGFVDEQDKYDAYAAANLFCNPSAFESFSIVIMESWYSGRPVLVFEGCSVTKRFAEISNGGLYFSNFEEFKECLDLLLTNERLANKLGENGALFVKSRYTWDKVISNYLDFVDECFEGNKQ